MQSLSRFTLPALALIPGLLAGPTVQASELPMAEGEHWVSATDREKRAFLLGMATILELEQEFQAQDPPAPGASVVPPMLNGLDNYTLIELQQAVDQWYADNPGGMDRAVVEVIWTEFALPNLNR